MPRNPGDRTLNVTASLPSTQSLPFNAEALDALRATLHGDAFLPDDDGYARAIAAWSLLVRHTPYLAVMPVSDDDIVATVTFAAAHDFPVGVMGSGHGQPVPCAGGILINTSLMRGVEIDPETRTARVEPGAKWADVIPMAQQHGLAPLNGSSSDVGVVGYTLGGGHGWMTRKYGRVADCIVAAELVTATGEQIRVTEASHPELLWALRGGSGNFGVITALEFGLVSVTEVYGGAVMYPLDEAASVLRAFSAWSPSLPAEITASVGFMRFPPLPQLPPQLQGAAVVVVRACAIGDLVTGAELIAPMRDLGSPLMDTFGNLPYAAIDSISMDPVDPMPFRATTMVLRDLDDATIDALLAVAGPDVDTPVMMIDVRDLRPAPGGANGCESDPRARIDGLALYAIAVPHDPAMVPDIDAALAAIRETLAPVASERVMLNFLGDGDQGAERTRAAFPAEAWERLSAIKWQYDPKNRFRFNHNIAPTGE